MPVGARYTALKARSRDKSIRQMYNSPDRLPAKFKSPRTYMGANEPTYPKGSMPRCVGSSFQDSLQIKDAKVCWEQLSEAALAVG